MLLYLPQKLPPNILFLFPPLQSFCPVTQGGFIIYEECHKPFLWAPISNLPLVELVTFDDYHLYVLACSPILEYFNASSLSLKTELEIWLLFPRVLAVEVADTE